MSGTVERVTWEEDGSLDEIVGTKGVHLEYLGGKRWYLSVGHEDGSQSVFWFKSNTLKRPFWEKREPPKAKQ